MVRRLNESDREPLNLSYTEVYSNVYESVNEMVNNIFAEYQNRYGIDSGDIDPMSALDLDEKMENLTETIVQILDNQY